MRYSIRFLDARGKYLARVEREGDGDSVAEWGRTVCTTGRDPENEAIVFRPVPAGFSATPLPTKEGR